MQPENNSFRHLKSLSAYARSAFAGRSRHKCPEPVIHLKSEVLNNRGTKRKLEDSNQDLCFETPAKKRLISCKVSTPDAGCLLSQCSFRMGKHSPVAPSEASLFAKTPPIKITTSESVNLEPVACKYGPEACSVTRTDPRVFKYEHVFEPETGELLRISPYDPCKDTGPNGKDEDVDKGYLSMCLTPSLHSLPAPSPILKPSADKSHSSNKASRAVKGPYPAVSGLSLDSAVESFREVDEVWNIGPPVLESSVCEKVERGSGSQTGAEVQPNYDCNSNFDTSLKVQVKSVVHVVARPISSSAQATPHGEDLDKELFTSKPSTSKVFMLCGRQVVLNTEADWEREKKMYVQSVHRHLSEASDAAQDAVSELRGLMTQVGQDSSGRPWQHPSDLTRRNYRARTHQRNDELKMSLDEWQAKNMLTHKRFEKVPKIFERSSV
ncbi:S100P-binding protein isoform X2 [Vanacampus margaritifer]